MFIVSVGFPASNTTFQPPNANELSELQTILTQGEFVARSEPKGNISSIVQQVCSQVIEQIGWPVCHTVAKSIANQFPSQGLRRETGYLIKNSIDWNFLTQLPRQHPPYFSLNDQTGFVDTWLHHHSVIVDSQGNRIECIPDFYPISDYVFVSHPSGAQGYFLRASWQTG